MQAYRTQMPGGTMFWIVMLSALSLGGAAAVAGHLLAPSFVWWILLGAAFLTSLLLLPFRRLDLTVDSNGVRACWGGLFSKTVALDDIASVQVGRYRWISFGGWGWRYNLKGDVAFSILGVNPTLEVTRRNGRKLVVTLTDPQAAADAINDWLAA